MSLQSIGSEAKMTVTCENSGSSKVKSFYFEKHLVSGCTKELNKKLFRELFEEYLNSVQFQKDVYQLESVINIRFERSVLLSVYR